MNPAARIAGALPLPLGRRQAPSAESVDGFFPAESMIRRLHGQRIVAISGVRALLMQACDPLAVVGFDRHSKIFSDPQKRLVSTDQRMSRMYFGDKETALRTGAEIQAMHGRVSGKVTEDYGPIPAGTPYAADDPELMLWTLATLADSALLYYQRFVGRLDDDERESYWSDYRQIGLLLGMPATSMPANEPELREYIQERLGDGSLYISGDIRDRSKAIIFDPPFRGLTRIAVAPLTEAIKLSSVGLLPPEIRYLYGFSWNPVREAMLDASVLQIRIAQRLWLDAVRKHPAARAPAGDVFGERPRRVT